MVTTKSVVSLLLFIALTIPVPLRAQEKGNASAAEQYNRGTSRVSKHFWILYQEFGKPARDIEILRKCGYKREADELHVYLNARAIKRLEALIEDDIMDNKLRAMDFPLARAGAHSMWFGHSLGYQDSFSLTSEILPARTYDSFCNATLKGTRKLLEEASK
jgi:hypothetical protein